MNSDPPRAVGLADLGQLPMRANVAFAMRCALRVMPWFKIPATAPKRREQIAAINNAMAVAEAFCMGVPMEAGRAAVAVERAAVVAEETCSFTCFASYGPVRAAEAAARAEECVRNEPDASVTEVVAAAFGAGRVLAANADVSTMDLIVGALAADVEKLRKLAHGTCADLGPPIDPSEKGPLGSLWPGGIPSWYVTEQESA
jgi:hypothetical protein